MLNFWNKKLCVIMKLLHKKKPTGQLYYVILQLFTEVCVARLHSNICKTAHKFFIAAQIVKKLKKKNFASEKDF